jgi:YHS domain-containing protein
MLSSTAGLVCIPVSTGFAESTPQRIQRSNIVQAVGQQASVKVVQVAAASEPGRLEDQPAARLAIEQSRSAKSTGKDATKIRQVAASNTGATQNSEVQKKLEELYRKDGRPMPPMAVDQLPDQNLKQKVPPLPKQSAQASQPVMAQSRLGGFFKNINPFRKNENNERPKHVEAMPPEVARQQQAIQSQGSAAQPARQYQQPQRPAQTQQLGSNFVPPAPTAPPAAPAAEPPQFSAPGLLSPGSGSIGRAINSSTPAPGDLPEFKPAVQLPQTAKTSAAPVLPVAKQPDLPTAKQPELPALTSELSDVPFTGEVEVKKPAAEPSQASSDDLDNAFPELSETEADKGKAAAKAATPKPEPAKVETTEEPKDQNPFTGLKLEAEEELKSAAQEIEKKAPMLPGGLTLPLPEPAKFAADDDEEDDDEEEMTASKSEPSLDPAAKMKKIADRKDLKGFKGFCPVVLRDSRDLIDARPQFKETYLGKVYNFSSEEAREKFTKNPKQYAPISGGRDIVALKDESQDVEGKLDYAAWFKDRLYLFNSAKTKDKFELQPSKYLVEE